MAISSTKSMTGHLLGGSGGIEAVATAMAIANNRVPPTINLVNPDPECDLDYIPNSSRQHQVNAALSNSFGFGGTNAHMVVEDGTRFSKSSRLGKFNSLIIKTSQVLKTLKVQNIDILGHPELSVVSFV